MHTPPVALTIAGSEATGGAGAQVDLKTFQQHGVFGCVALTCIVSFDPKDEWNHRFVPVEPQVIADQLEVLMVVDQGTEAAAHERLVVGDRDLDHAGTAAGMCAATR